MTIETLKQDLDGDYEGSICDMPSENEIRESRDSFINGLKKAVKNGGKVIVEKRGRNSYFYFKETKGPSWCISENEAVEYCGYCEQ